MLIGFEFDEYEYQYDPPPGPEVLVVGTTVIGVLVTRTNPKYER